MPSCVFISSNTNWQIMLHMLMRKAVKFCCKKWFWILQFHIDCGICSFISLIATISLKQTPAPLPPTTGGVLSHHCRTFKPCLHSNWWYWTLQCFWVRQKNTHWNLKNMNKFWYSHIYFDRIWTIRWINSFFLHATNMKLASTIITLRTFMHFYIFTI